MRRIDELHLEYPFAGSRMLRGLLQGEGHAAGRRHVRTLMRRMALHALYRKPRTTVAAAGRHVYPYLLRGATIDHANQVWSTDITYIPMARGFVYLAAVVDWYSRRVLAWHLSNTMTLDFCIEAVTEALARHGEPEIFNTDQGTHHKMPPYRTMLARHGITQSMSRKGNCLDNAPIESFFGTLKVELFRLQSFASIEQLEAAIHNYIRYYNGERIKLRLDGLSLVEYRLRWAA